MRIISGGLKGKKLFPIKGQTTRPTSDRLRESIFNILSNQVAETMVLDLFAGTGALGIEAMSRGARFSYFIDNNKNAVSLINKNIQACRLEERSVVIQWDIHKNLNCIKKLEKTFNLVFMDPPYRANLIKPTLSNLHQSGALRTGTSLIIEHSQNELLPINLKYFAIADQRKYQKTILSILKYHN